MVRSCAIVGAVLLLSAGILSGPAAEVSLKFSGDALYRLQFDYFKNKDDTGGVATQGDLTNRYAYNMRLSLTVNDNLAFAIRLSNPTGYSTDNIATTLKWASAKDAYSIIAIPEFSFKWTVSIVTLTGGILTVGPPTSYSTVLDLVAFESSQTTGTAWCGGYYGAGQSPWYVVTNATMAGLDLLLSFYKSEAFSAALDVVGAFAQDAGRGLALDAIKRDQIRLYFAAPIGLKGSLLCFQPALHLRSNVYRSTDLKKGNWSAAGGLDVWSKPIDNKEKKTSLEGRVGFAVGGYSNSSQWHAGFTEDSMTAPLGVLLNAGMRVSPGYGRFVVDFAYGHWQDRERDSMSYAAILPDTTVRPKLGKLDNVDNLLFWDIMFDAPVKSLTFRTRLRIWDWLSSESKRTKLQLRPELDLIAKF